MENVVINKNVKGKLADIAYRFRLTCGLDFPRPEAPAHLHFLLDRPMLFTYR